MPRMVSRLAEHVPQQPVARLGDWSTMLLAASRRLRGNHAGVGHELRCRSEAAQYRTCRCCIISTGPASTYVALRGMSFVRPRNLRYCVGRPFHVDQTMCVAENPTLSGGHQTNSGGWPIRLAARSVQSFAARQCFGQNGG